MVNFLPSLWSRNSDDPFNAMRREMDELMRGFGSRAPSRDIGAAAPAIDIAETNSAVEITVELPGVDEKDIRVSLDGNRLVIAGEKKSAAERNDKDWRVVERSYGSFHRSVALPFEPQDDAVSAHFDKGVLHLEVKKTVEAATKVPKTIEIKAGAPTSDLPPKAA